MSAINRSALRRNAAADLLKKTREAANNKGFDNEDRGNFWKLTVDQAGNGAAVIRFLPSKTEDSLPFVKVYDHGFKDKVTGRWYINQCPTTIGEQCPVCSSNHNYWSTGLESDKAIVRERKRRMKYIANILVLKDPKAPENEGKVFAYRFGAKIYEKLMMAMNPPEEFGEEPRDPFSFFDGCVVKLKQMKKDGWPNFDATVVEPASDLYDGDEEKLEALLEQMGDLNDFVDPKRFKSYDQLEADFIRATGGNPQKRADPVEEEDEEETYTPPRVEKKAEAPAKPKQEVVEEDEDEDDALDFFRNLAD